MNKAIILALFITAGAMLVGGLVVTPVVQVAEANHVGGFHKVTAPDCRSVNEHHQPLACRIR